MPADRFAQVLGNTRGGGQRATRPDTPHIPAGRLERLELIRDAIQYVMQDIELRHPQDRYLVVGKSQFTGEDHLLGVCVDTLDIEMLAARADDQDFHATFAVDLDGNANTCVHEIEYISVTDRWVCDRLEVEGEPLSELIDGD